MATSNQNKDRVSVADRKAKNASRYAEAEVIEAEVLDKNAPRIRIKFIWKDGWDTRKSIDILSGEVARKFRTQQGIHDISNIPDLAAEKDGWQRKAGTGRTINIAQLEPGLNGWYISL